ncbi:oxygen-independent coproporphyrinogen III oxidase [Anaerocolumna sedimenticola]|uniref:Heme chaperone HemW n=1 Tax=Anaerocolumna sedimenticola TaxID=2696063 RepID=A0A6P1TQ67_9FIRM|nr:radical SAM family heme chaperone HemW [Anaerocolumna sedimenticola]QHQ61926.1 oxygen-independent coproporphyrinogen III oxidase [Anaerocolumna sedimenticola]
MINGQKKDLGLYIHIPFCVRKCDYCDFLSAPADEETKNKYVKALIAEIKSYKQVSAEYLVKTIFIGGGTPSSLEGKLIQAIMDTIREVFRISSGDIEEQPEITIEVNPGTITREKLLCYKNAGINRLSFGLQSADNNELKMLGRIHTYETFKENYNLARELGFRNINIDLMSGLPGQTLENWLYTLQETVKLDPEHISAYSLIIEEGTPFYLRYREEDQDEELDRKIYAETKEYLEKTGYYRYEISNYAKPGFESRHNSSYWLRTDYLGLGLGASSLLNKIRFQNEDNLSVYLKNSAEYHNIRRNEEPLTKNQQMEEFMFLGLRMSKGISKNNFKKIFGETIESIYGEIINKSLFEGLIEAKGDKIYLTDKGIDLSNVVLSRFLLD